MRCDGSSRVTSLLEEGQAEVLSYGGCVIGAVVFDVGECLVDETRE